MTPGADTLKSADFVPTGVVTRTILSAGAGWRVSLLAKTLTTPSHASFPGQGGAFVNRAVLPANQRYIRVNLRDDF